MWNSLTTEGDYALTPRTSLTLVGGYSFLAYPDGDLFNSWTATGRIGYNYLWTPKDTVAVFYTYSGIRYSNVDQSIDAHSFQASYARRVTGRLAFQVAVGPQVVVSRIPISSGTQGTNTTQVFLALNTSAQYQLRRVALRASYDHWVSPGSGVFAGAVTDTVQGTATRQMSPTFSSGLTAGYSRNSGLVPSGIHTVTQNYNYWYVGTNLTHPWRTIGLTLSYQLQYQDSNGAFCTGGGASCGTSYVRHLISVGVGWHGERVILR